MSRQMKILCGVPDGECSGDLTITGPKWSGHRKVHTTREEAFRCKAKHLTRLGYTQVGSQEFSPPDGGPVLALTKKSRFGDRARRGKENRYMPDRGGVIGGA